jgi:thiosulfate reductase cytochrome b subunit
LPEEESKRTSIRTGYRLADGMNWHFTLAWLFSLNGLAYVLYLLFSKEYKLLLPKKDSFKGAFLVVLHDLKIYKKPLPDQKFNHAQRIAYSSVIVLGFLMIVTGLAIYKPAQLGGLALFLGGYQAARLEHFIITCLFVMFFFVHIFQVMRAGWNNFRAMITGWEILPEKGENGVETIDQEVEIVDKEAAKE